jgi:hypothetical protein
MGLLGFGRRADAGLQRQRQAIAQVSAEFANLDERFAGLPELRASFASVWEDAPEVEELGAKMPKMRELIGMFQLRADQAKGELQNFDEPITFLAREIGYGQGLLEKLSVTLLTKQGLAASRDPEQR